MKEPRACEVFLWLPVDDQWHDNRGKDAQDDGHEHDQQIDDGGSFSHGLAPLNSDPNVRLENALYALR